MIVPVTQAMTQPPLQEGGLERRLQGQLQNLLSCIRDTAMNDEKTEVIKLWANEFRTQLHKGKDKVEVIFEAFANLLQGHLVDHRFNTPFDDKAILGSDGKTYNLQAYTVWKDEVEAEYKGCSPTLLDRNEHFTHRDHDVVRFALNWLQDHGKRPIANDALFKKYEAIINRPKREQLRAIRAALAQDRSEEQRVQRENDLAWQAEDEQAKLEDLRPFVHAEQLVDALYQQTLVRLNALALVPQQLESNDNQRRIEALYGRIATVNRELDALDPVCGALLAKQAQQQQDINQLKTESTELQQSINRVKKAFKKQEQNDLLGFAKTVGVLAASAVASYICPYFGVAVLATSSQTKVMGGTKF